MHVHTTSKEKYVDYFLTKYGVPSTTSSQQCCLSPQIKRNVGIVEDLPNKDVSTSPLHNKSTRNLAIAIPAEETNNKNPKSPNVRDQCVKNQPSNKQRPRQLPLSKNRSANASFKAAAQIYFHAVFMTHPRHKLPKDTTSHESIILNIFNQLPQKPKVDSQSRWNSTIASWNSSGKTSMSSIPPLLANKDNIGDDGLMSQSMFNTDIDNEVYLNQLCPNPNLVDDSTPPLAELSWHYTKLFDTLIVLRLKMSCDKTLSTLRHPGELVNIKLADVSATDIIVDIDNAKFTDW